MFLSLPGEELKLLHFQSRMSSKEGWKWRRRLTSYPKPGSITDKQKVIGGKSGSRIPRENGTGECKVSVNTLLTMACLKGRDAACGWQLCQLNYDAEEEALYAIY